MKISIITPTYNADYVLEDALKSVSRQSFQDFEHIIVDARSTDGTLDIVKDYNRLRYVSEPDQGIYDAMNKGIKIAKGEWLYFLGADDRLHDDEVLANISTELVEPYDIIYGDVLSDRFKGRYGGAFDFLRLVGNENICHQSVFFNRRVFEIVGEFDLRYPSQSDWDHNLKWASNNKIQARHVDLIIADYADGGQSSILGDETFQWDKRFNALKYGYSVLPTAKSLEMVVKEAFKSLKHGNVNRFLECIVIGTKIPFAKLKQGK